MLASGWLLGEEHIKGKANILSHRVGKGLVVTYGSQVGYRTWSRSEFKLLFNAMFHRPSEPVAAADFARTLAQ